MCLNVSKLNFLSRNCRKYNILGKFVDCLEVITSVEVWLKYLRNRQRKKENAEDYNSPFFIVVS